MATHKSAAKRARQSVKRNQHNKHYLTRMRNLLRETRSLVKTEAKEKLQPKLNEVTSLVQKLVEKKIIHKKTGSRYLSRISRHISQFAGKKS